MIFVILQIHSKSFFLGVPTNINNPVLFREQKGLGANLLRGESMPSHPTTRYGDIPLKFPVFELVARTTSFVTTGAKLASRGIRQSWPFDSKGTTELRTPDSKGITIQDGVKSLVAAWDCWLKHFNLEAHTYLRIVSGPQ